MPPGVESPLKFMKKKNYLDLNFFKLICLQKKQGFQILEFDFYLFILLVVVVVASDGLGKLLNEANFFMYEKKNIPNFVNWNFPRIIEKKI